MTVLLVIGTLLGGFVLLVLRSLAIDEVRGRLQQRVRNHVEDSIALLSPELQEEWAEEWRADLAQVISAPLTAIVFARNVRRAAFAIAADLVPAPVSTDAARPVALTSRVASTSQRFRALIRRLQRVWSTERLDDFVQPTNVVISTIAGTVISFGVSVLFHPGTVIALISLASCFGSLLVVNVWRRRP